MPASVPTLVLKGLAEGLTLRAAEREPVEPEGLVDRFETLLDHRPHDNQVDSVLRSLSEADLVRQPGEEEGYQLTQDGARRLSRYRRLPDPFKQAAVELFRIQPSHLSTATRKAGSTPHSGEDRYGPEPKLSGDGWVAEALEAIPTRAKVQARYARVSFDRDPGARAWTLRVEQHEPGRYEGAASCPLTFLYEAATRLLSRARGPPRNPDGDGGRVQASP